MTGRKKLILGFAAADFVIILLVLLLLPFQTWEPVASTQADLDEFEARTAQHFERIENGNGLDLGSFDTLAQVIEFYSGGGGAGVGMNLPNLDDKIRPFSLSPQEKSDLIAFLHALTDESKKPEIPEHVPSGLRPVENLANQSPEMAAFSAPPRTPRQLDVERNGNVLRVRAGMQI